MKGEGRDAYTISEFQRYYNENERKAYRDQAEFRELWPEFETPNELAGQILPQLRGRLDTTKLPSSVMVEADLRASLRGSGSRACEACLRSERHAATGRGGSVAEGTQAV
jgi:hypothetical protein